MNEKLLDDMKHNISAVMQLMEVNAAAVEKLMNQQTSLASDLLKSNIAHGKSLVDCKDVSALVEANKAWSRELGEKLAAAGKANAKVVEAARGEAASLIEEMTKVAQSQFEAGAAEIRSRVEASVEDAKAKVEDAVKTVQGQAAKTKAANKSA